MNEVINVALVFLVVISFVGMLGLATNGFLIKATFSAVICVASVIGLILLNKK